MNTEENKNLVRRFYEAVSGKDKPRERLTEFVADEELIAHVLIFEAAFPRYEISADDLIAEGDRVAVRATVRGRHQGTFLGMAPTGREVTQSALIIYEVAGGKIIRHWMGFDGLSLMKQLGHRAGAQ